MGVLPEYMDALNSEAGNTPVAQEICMRTIGALIILLSCFVFSGLPSAWAKVPERIVGGQFLSLEGTPVAFIVTPSYSCSGTLIGQSVVLTAAHCIEAAADDYFVYVGGRYYKTTGAWYSASFNQYAATSLANSQYDLGVLILEAPVTNVTPMPVIEGRVLRSGMNAWVYGYGSNEYSYDEDFTGIGGAKGGHVVMSSFSTGMITSYSSKTGVAICSGDSGGPLIYQEDSILGVAGVSSSGTSRDDYYGACMAMSGRSDYVDLESSASRGFLANFRGIEYVNLTYADIAGGAGLIATATKKLTKLTSVKAIKQKVSVVIKTVKILDRISAGPRRSQTQRALKALNKVSGLKNLKAIRSAINVATSAMSALASMSPYLVR